MAPEPLLRRGSPPPRTRGSRARLSIVSRRRGRCEFVRRDSYARLRQRARGRKMANHVYVFRAGLVGHRGIHRTIAVRSDQTLVDVHYALQAAFDWDDDHLYSFWLDGEFWSRNGREYTHPF